MADYIKREDAIQAFDPQQRQDWYTPWIVETLKDLPSADVAPVVRCKDCKHRIKWKESYGCAFWGYYGDEFADGEMFCSKGERKDDDIL